MTAPLTPPTDELALLRGRIAALESRGPRPRWRFPRRLRALAAGGLLAALLPLGIMAAAPTFTDLGDAAEVHRGDIQAIAAVGITTGFDDPNSSDPNVRVYYPTDNVSRQEMASFLARLGGLGGNPPVANAATAVNAQTAQTAQGVAPGAITPASISSAGATPGQVLTATSGGGVAFQNSAGGGVSGAVVRQATVSVSAAGPAAVPCQATERATGGGYGAVTGVTVGESRPAFDPANNNRPTGWSVSVTPIGALPGSVIVYAVCVPVQ